MLNDDLNPILDQFTRGIVRRKVQQLVGRAGFKPQDHEDLEQELFVRILQSLPRFNPNQAHRNVFVTTVVERYVANILRNKLADKRDHRRIGSLNVSVEIRGEDPVELAQTISQLELDARRGRRPRSADDLAQLVQDVAEVVAALPVELQDLAVRLKSQSISEVARQMSVPRTTLYESVRRLRRRFERAGLKDYL